MPAHRTSTLALLAFMVVGAPAHANTYKSYEAPAYTVERAVGAAEIRLYEAHSVAEVTVEGGRSQAASRAFRMLAGYIFGRNATSEKIAMTVPVSQIPQGDGYVVRFMLPKAYGLEDLPTPTNAGIRVQQVDPGRQAVVRFSGRSSAGNLAKHQRQLEAFVTDQGLTATGPLHYYFYDDPFTLPMARRNEVALPVQ